MMDFKSNLSQALAKLGCDTSRFNFDDRSPIALTFTDIGDLFLVCTDGQVWMWATLPDFSEAALRGVAFNFLNALAIPAPYLAGEALGLRADEDHWRVGGQLRADCVDDVANLAGAIEGFYLRVTTLYEAMK
jgi:hypothetical protein